MYHFSHKHSLILNEVYIARAGDECFMCQEGMVSCKSFVYSCTRITGGISTNVGDKCVRFLLHKSCAELPPTIENPSNKKQSLFLWWLRDQPCNICSKPSRRIPYASGDWKFLVCLECAVFHLQSLEDREFEHLAHSQHTLFLVQHPSSFITCHACKMESDIKDLSYICTKCPFWMHKSCADAPTCFIFPFHDKHPLILSFSLPRVYQKFDQHCRLCNKQVYQSLWIYYCPKCRFFAHFGCAISSQRYFGSSHDEICPDLVHLPAADESRATNVLVKQYVEAMSSSLNYDIIYDERSSIKHWADCEHRLQLITFNELNYEKDDENDILLLLCDCCVKPIRTDVSDQFYGCVSCNNFVHQDCAKLPNKLKHPAVWPSLTLSAGKYMLFYCDCCDIPGNGICFQDDGIALDIGCALLPKKIKHEAHHHQLDLVVTKYNPIKCKGCGFGYDRIKYRCVICDVYICTRCIMMERTAKDRWDPHPLDLIYEAGMVADHEHEFDCEFCSEEIDTNYWFRHCSHCDLSFHVDCFGKSCYGFLLNRSIKFGGTDIIIDKLHPHGLTLILNKRRFRRCEKCDAYQHGKPVLECTQCKLIFCYFCTRCSM